MSKEYFDYNETKIHFIGIGGVSMSGLAKHLLYAGYAVSGSDSAKSQTLVELERLGAKIFDRHLPSNLNDVDAVVYTSAISKDNPELKRAIAKNIPVYKRSQILGKILESYKRSVAISGCHGKTTATAMIADACILAGLDPTVFLGGESVTYGNYRQGNIELAIAEACEFKKNFLDMRPNVSVVLNLDNDHLDSFSDMKDMIATFNQFVSSSISVLNADDRRVSAISNMTSVTYGIEKLATYSAKRIKFNGKGYSFSAYAYSMSLGRVNLSVMGKHNIYNALATIAVCDLLKVPFAFVKRALENFKGVKRRMEYIGSVFGAECYADYAHHPNELKASIAAFTQLNEPFAVVFQPHTYSRTKYLMKDFVQVLKELNDTVIYQTYPAREKFDEKGSGLKLYENLICSGCGGIVYATSKAQLKTALSSITKNYKKLLFLGAGDIYEIAKSIMDK